MALQARVVKARGNLGVGIHVVKKKKKTTKKKPSGFFCIL